MTKRTKQKSAGNFGGFLLAAIMATEVYSARQFKKMAQT